MTDLKNLSRTVRQIGDPVLRSKAERVNDSLISTPDFQHLVQHLVQVMKENLVKGGTTAISAPQIGVNLRVFIMKDDYGITRSFIPGEEKFAVFVNPTLKVLDNSKKEMVEGCSSLVGFSAEVPRDSEVMIKGVNEDGEDIEFHAKGWAARVIQHEMDHLNGVMYTDKMICRTFKNDDWNEYI